MARRSDHSRDELLELVIQAGHSIIEEEGLHGFSARKLAKAIGYTVGTLYNLFDDLDDIILHLNAHTLDTLHEHLLTHAERNASPKAAIKSLAAHYAAFAKEHPHSWSALFEFSLPEGKAIPDWYQKKINQLFALVQEALASDYPNATDARLTANVLWASIHGICQLGMTGKLEAVEAGSITELTDSLIDNYMQSSS